jgi:hypothetical protein
MKYKFADEAGNIIATVTTGDEKYSIAFDPLANLPDRKRIEILLSTPYRTIGGKSSVRRNRHGIAEIINATIEVIVRPEDPIFMDTLMADAPKLGLKITEEIEA